MTAEDAKTLTTEAQRNKINERQREEQQRKTAIQNERRWFNRNKERWFNEEVEPAIIESAKNGKCTACIVHQGETLISEKIAFLKTKGFEATHDTHLWRPADDVSEQETTSILIKW